VQENGNRLDAAEVELQRGDRAAALALVAALDAVDGPNADVSRRDALTLRAQLALADGDPFAAARSLDTALALAVTPSGERGMRYARVRWWQAATALAARRPDEAAAFFADAAMIWTGDPRTWETILDLEPQLPAELIVALLPADRARPLLADWRATWAHRLPTGDARLRRLDALLAATRDTPPATAPTLAEFQLHVGLALFQAMLSAMPEPPPSAGMGRTPLEPRPR
jgi:hypothetical protein